MNLPSQAADSSRQLLFVTAETIKFRPSFSILFRGNKLIVRASDGLQNQYIEYAVSQAVWSK